MFLSSVAILFGRIVLGLGVATAIHPNKFATIFMRVVKESSSAQDFTSRTSLHIRLCGLATHTRGKLADAPLTQQVRAVLVVVVAALAEVVLVVVAEE